MMTDSDISPVKIHRKVKETVGTWAAKNIPAKQRQFINKILAKGYLVQENGVFRKNYPINTINIHNSYTISARRLMYLKFIGDIPDTMNVICSNKELHIGNLTLKKCGRPFLFRDKGKHSVKVKPLREQKIISKPEVVKPQPPAEFLKSLTECVNSNASAQIDRLEFMLAQMCRQHADLYNISPDIALWWEQYNRNIN